MPLPACYHVLRFFPWFCVTTEVKKIAEAEEGFASTASDFVCVLCLCRCP